MVTQLREATRTARKPHRCGACNVVIGVGESHHVSTNVFDGRVYDWRECAGCAEDRIVSEVYFWCGQPDEGVDFESAWEWAHESRDDPTYGAMALRWLARSGCSCERCETGVRPPAMDPGGRE